jgi:hypothetical protein
MIVEGTEIHKHRLLFIAASFWGRRSLTPSNCRHTGCHGNSPTVHLSSSVNRSSSKYSFFVALRPKRWTSFITERILYSCWNCLAFWSICCKHCSMIISGVMLVQCMDESQYANRLEIWGDNTKMNLKYSYTKISQNSDFLQSFFFIMP